MGSNTFGKSVIGAEAFAKAVESDTHGAEIFGKRVTGVGRAENAEQAAKAASQFGVLVANNVTASGLDGKSKGLALSTKELEDVLTENPTFFDSLFEGEMARAGGPRKDALVILRNFEMGIKGAGRQHVLEEINEHLGQGQIDAKALAERYRAVGRALDEQHQREQENALLGDADRVKALAEREENLAKVKKAQSASGAKSGQAGTPGEVNATQPSATSTPDGETEQEGGSTKSNRASERGADADEGNKPESGQKTTRKRGGSVRKLGKSDK